MKSPQSLRVVAHWLVRLSEAAPERRRLECLMTAADLRDRARRLEDPGPQATAALEPA